MSWANASFLPGVLPQLPEGTATSSTSILRAIFAIGELGEDARKALRLYSRSEQAGQWDGQALNGHLVTNGDHELSGGMDLACSGWSTRKPILVWRNWRAPYRNSVPIGYYASCSMVERQARRFGARAGGLITAIVLPPGTMFAVPTYVWNEGDDARTLGVVKRERELVLGRGSVLEEIAAIVPYEGAPKVRVLRLAT